MKYIHFVFLVLILFSCNLNDDKKVLFVGFENNTSAALTVSCRNGLKLALNNFLRENSINLNIVELDDITKEKFNNYLIKNNVEFIIGPLSNEFSEQVIEIINTKKVLAVSPLANEMYLKGKDDYFFTFNPEISITALDTVDMIKSYSKVEQKTIAIIYQEEDTTYFKTFKDLVIRELSDYTVKEFPYGTDLRENSDLILNNIKIFDPSIALIIDKDMNTSFISQKLRIYNKNIDLYGIESALTQRVIVNGGKSVDGLKVSTTLVFEPKDPEVVEFIRLFQAEYGFMGDPIAYLSYLSTKLVLKSYKLNRYKKKDLKNILINQKNDNGENLFDKYGDALKKPHRIIIKSGNLKSLE